MLLLKKMYDFLTKRENKASNPTMTFVKLATLYNQGGCRKPQEASLCLLL